MRYKFNILIYDNDKFYFKIKKEFIDGRSPKVIRKLNEYNIKNFIGHFKIQSIEIGIKKQIQYISYSRYILNNYVVGGFSIVKLFK